MSEKKIKFCAHTEYSNPSKLANFGGKILGHREFGNRELGDPFY